MKMKILKDILDMLAAFFTIVVSWAAIAGGVRAYESGFFHKLDKVVTHYHNEITKTEENDIEKMLK